MKSNSEHTVVSETLSLTNQNRAQIAGNAKDASWKITGASGAFLGNLTRSNLLISYKDGTGESLY